MTTDFTTLSLSQVMAELDAVAADARKVFGALEAHQLNWKPSAEQWSVGQCFDHLIVTNSEYFPVFDEIARGEKRTTLRQRLPVWPGFCGRFLINALSSTKQKFKAPPKFQPTLSAVDAGIINRFVAHQAEVAAKLASFERVAADKIIIYSPVTKLMTYSLLDACRLIAAHERRHFAQAQRVLETTGFPG